MPLVLLSEFYIVCVTCNVKTGKATYVLLVIVSNKRDMRTETIYDYVYCSRSVCIKNVHIAYSVHTCKQ